MLKRIITGAIMFAILLPLVLINSVVCEYLFLVLVFFLGFYSSFEFIKGSRLKVLNKYKIFLSLLCACIVFLCSFATNIMSFDNSYEGFVYLFLFFIFGIFIIFGLLIFNKESSASDYAFVLLNLVYCGLFLGLAFSLRFFEPANINLNYLNLNGTRCFIYIFTVVVITDSFAYLIGCKYGKKRLCPHISPKKSIEGSIGGLVFGTVIGFFSLFLYGIMSFKSFNFITALILFITTILISCSVQLGDLIESKLKRSFDIKDFGNILPGHGGILDRFDSFIYSGVIFYLLLTFIEIVI